MLEGLMYITMRNQQQDALALIQLMSGGNLALLHIPGCSELVKKM
jgi:hypothetical protein